MGKGRITEAQMEVLNKNPISLEGTPAMMDHRGPGHGWVEISRDGVIERMRYASTIEAKGSKTPNGERVTDGLGYKVLGNGRVRAFVNFSSAKTCEF